MEHQLTTKTTTEVPVTPPVEDRSAIRALVGRQVLTTVACPMCERPMQVVSKLLMHTFIMKCVTVDECELVGWHIKIRNGKVIAVMHVKQ